MELLWRNVGESYPSITIWNLVAALTIQHIMPFMNLSEPLEICMPPPPKCMIPRQEVQAKFNDFRDAQRSDDEVYTDQK